jgi:rhodanese-related sulfurtransferase
MKNKYFGWIALLIIGLSVYLYRYAIVSNYRISSEAAKQYIQTKQIDLILDVRTETERTTLGYYPNSVHISGAELDKEMPRRFPDKTIRILTYCNTGHRARLAVDKLQTLGYKNARYISSTYTSLL